MATKHRHIEPIPCLKGSGQCNDWLNRYNPRPEEVHHYELWLVAFRTHTYGSEQEGKRPALILSNDIGNERSHIVTVAPLTSRLKRLEMPTHVLLENGVDGGEPSVILIEQTTTVDKKRLVKKLGEITDPALLREIDNAVRVQFGL